MPNALLERLRSEYTDTKTRVESIQTGAATADRDLTEAEQANVEELLERAEKLQPRILDMVRQEEQFGATADALATVRPPSGPPAHERSAEVLRSLYPDPGHYVLDLMLAKGNVPNRSEHESAEARTRITRAGEIQRALANQTTADNAGILPVTIVGDVVNVIDASRPVFSSFTSRPMPQLGKTFQRPIIGQHTLVAKQTAEKTELASQKLTITGINLTKETYGGALDISVQDIEWTDPAILNIAIGDLGDQYALQTEAAASAVLAAITQTSPLPASPTPAQVNTFIAAASALVYAGGKTMPDRLWASVDMWGKLMGLSATDGRPAFPSIGASNAAGTLAGATSFNGNVLGLPLVVGPALPAGTLIVGASKYAESFEDRKGAVRAFEVSLLGWEVGYYGYAVCAILVPGAFCKAV